MAVKGAVNPGSDEASDFDDMSEDDVVDAPKTSLKTSSDTVKQGRLAGSDVNTIVARSHEIEDYSSSTAVVGGNRETLHSLLYNTDQLVIVHPTTDLTIVSSDTLVQDVQRREGEVIEAARRQEHSTLDRPTKVTHILPVVESGRMPGSLHIRLRVVIQYGNNTFKEVYGKRDPAQNMRFDPRDIAQGTLDDTNCGRYVAAMTIQAAGLAREGKRITKENLLVSPAVKRALHFQSTGNAADGLKFTYVKPLANHASPEDRQAHYVQKLLCLKAEYQVRSQTPDRAFHGAGVGGYQTATFFTKTVGAKLGLAFSASDKLAAVDKILEKLDAKKPLSLKDLPPAAKQGELGQCVQAILKVQADKRYDAVQKGATPNVSDPSRINESAEQKPSDPKPS